MKRFYILVLVALFVGATVSAQEVTKKEAEKESTEARLAKLEKRIATQEKLRQYFHVSGFIQGLYEWHDAINKDNTTDISSFSVRRARLTLAGDLYKGKAGKLDYKFYFDIARVPKNPILDMCIKYQPCKEFGVQFGQFKNPVTFEASISPSKYDFIDFSYVVQNLAKMGSNDVAGLNVTARDIGFMFLGGFLHRDGYSIINYHVGLLNGSGINEKDNNKSKDVVGRLTLKPLKALRFSGSYYWGEYGKEYYARERWSFGTRYDDGRLLVGAEYFGGKTGLAKGEIDADGWYVMGGYTFCKKWTAAARYDTYQEKATEHYAKFEQTNYTVGLSFAPVKNIRLQANYVYEKYVVGHRNVAMVQLTAGF
jgi:phosphate-selective porin